jgi:hypothetical protein
MREIADDLGVPISALVNLPVLRFGRERHKTDPSMTTNPISCMVTSVGMAGGVEQNRIIGGLRERASG